MNMKQLVINIGRLMMVVVWGFLLLNLFSPFPSPLKYFLYVATGFTLFMHGLQLALLKSTLPKDGEKMGNAYTVRSCCLAFLNCWHGRANFSKSRQAVSNS